MQHLAWAKSRKAGSEEITRLQKCVQKVDMEIDDLEEQVNEVSAYGFYGVARMCLACTTI